MIRWDVDKSKLDPQFAADVDARLTNSIYSWAVVQGLRSEDEQRALYEKYLAGGPLAAKPGHSPHEHGLAVDVAQILPDGHLSWDVSHPAWPWLWEAIKATPHLHSGHFFPPVAPADDDHIQDIRWYTIRAGLKARGEW